MITIYIYCNACNSNYNTKSSLYLHITKQKVIYLLGGAQK